MVTEHALLSVTPGSEAAFEAALELALPIIRSAPGCRSASVSRGIESPSTYLLLVEWESVEAHTTGFRSSAAFQDWRGLLHHFYARPSDVEHFAPLA